MLLLLNEFWPYLLSGFAVIAGIFGKKIYDKKKVNQGRKEVTLEIQGKSKDKLIGVFKKNLDTEKAYEEIRDSIPDTWDAVNKLRKKGPINLRSPSTKLRKGG